METPTANPAATEASTAKPAHARKTMVALYAGRTAIVIASENAMGVGIAALLKTRRSESLMAENGTPVETASGIEAGLASSLSPGKPAGHFTIRVRHAETMCRIVCPDGTAQRLAMKMIEAVTVKERMIQDDGARDQLGVDHPLPAPSPASPSTEIQPEIDARAPTKANIDSWIEKAVGSIRRWAVPKRMQDYSWERTRYPGWPVRF